MYLLKLTTSLYSLFFSFVSIICRHFDDEDYKKEATNFIIKPINTLTFKSSA